MDDLPRQKLAELIGRYGRDLASDARRCEALLKDVCPQHKREIFALVSAAKESVGVELLGSSSGMPKEVLLSRLTKRLQENLGIVEDLACWAVESWALALREPSAEEYFERADTFFENGDFDKAILGYTEAIRRDPKGAWAYSNRGAAYRSKGDYDKAIADYTEAIRLDRKHAKAYNNRGWA